MGKESLPARERGLKHFPDPPPPPLPKSLPARERGLKLYRESEETRVTEVAPRAGAWIETDATLQASTEFSSLPARERGLKHLD